MAGSGVERWSADLIVGARTETDADVASARSAALLDARRRTGAPQLLPAHRRAWHAARPRSGRATPTTTCSAGATSSSTSCSRRAATAGTRSRTGRCPGEACRHNQLYWRQGDYLGLGAAAHSHRRGRRWWNVANLETYLEHGSPPASCPIGRRGAVEGRARAFEALALALRTRDGVPRERLRGLRGASTGFLEARGERLVLTRRGRLLADELVRRLDVRRERRVSEAGVDGGR